MSPDAAPPRGSALIPMWIPAGHDPERYGSRLSADIMGSREATLVLPHNTLTAREALIIGAVYEERDA